MDKWGHYYLIEKKTLWEKEKLLVTSNFSFFHNVFKSSLLLMRQNEYLWSKGLNVVLLIKEKKNVGKIYKKLSSSRFLRLLLRISYTVVTLWNSVLNASPSTTSPYYGHGASEKFRPISACANRADVDTFRIMH